MAKNKKTSEFVEAEKIEEEVIEEYEDDEEEDEEEFDEEFEDEEEEVKEEPRERHTGGFLTWMKENIKSIICVIVGILIGVVIMAFMWPERIAELSDGTQVVAEFRGKQYSADFIYNQTKTKYGLSALLEEVDEVYLSEKFKDRQSEIDEKAKEEADQYLSYYVSMAGYTEEEFYENMGFKDYNEMLKYLKRNALREQYVEDIINESITEEDLKTFYNLYAFGDKTAVYIFMGESKDDLESVRALLKQGKKFAAIDGKYDTVTGIQLNDTNFLDVYSEYGAEITNAIQGLKNGAFSKVNSSVNYKYFVVYAEGTAETAKYDDLLADEIRGAMVEDKQKSDPNLMGKTLIQMRKDNGFIIKDSELIQAYEEYKKQYE